MDAKSKFPMGLILLVLKLSLHPLHGELNEDRTAAAALTHSFVHPIKCLGIIIMYLPSNFRCNHITYGGHVAKGIEFIGVVQWHFGIYGRLIVPVSGYYKSSRGVFVEA